MPQPSHYDPENPLENEEEGLEDIFAPKKEEKPEKGSSLREDLMDRGVEEIKKGVGKQGKEGLEKGAGAGATGAGAGAAGGAAGGAAAGAGGGAAGGAAAGAGAGAAGGAAAGAAAGSVVPGAGTAAGAVAGGAGGGAAGGAAAGAGAGAAGGAGAGAAGGAGAGVGTGAAAQAAGTATTTAGGLAKDLASPEDLMGKALGDQELFKKIKKWSCLGFILSPIAAFLVLVFALTIFGGFYSGGEKAEGTEPTVPEWNGLFYPPLKIDKSLMTSYEGHSCFRPKQHPDWPYLEEDYQCAADWGWGTNDEPVYSIAPGRVVDSRLHYGKTSGEPRGYTVWVTGQTQDGKEYEAIYAHIRPKEGIAPGMELAAGEQIGIICPLNPGENEMYNNGPHLHFQLWVDGQIITFSQLQGDFFAPWPSGISPGPVLILIDKEYLYV